MTFRFLTIAAASLVSSVRSDNPGILQMGAAPDVVNRRRDLLERSDRKLQASFGAGGPEEEGPRRQLQPPSFWCSNQRPEWSKISNIQRGQCLNFRRDNNYDYPEDFNILNKVERYICQDSGIRVIISNGIPDHFHRQANPTAPCEWNQFIEIPLNPEYTDAITEPPDFGIIAIALNGVSIFGPLEGAGGNAMDPNGQFVGASYWYGHATRQGQDHYHSPKIGKEEETNEDILLGYALDGFKIYGSTSETTDVCNGSDHNGEYAYYVKNVNDIELGSNYCKADSGPDINWNYILGCYHGETQNTRYGSSAGYTPPADCVLEGSGPTATPTGRPTDRPTSAPTVKKSICVDTAFKFNGNKNNSCANYLKNKTPTDVKKACKKWDKFGRRVRHHCPKTCSYCVNARCKDETKFTVEHDGESYTCNDIPNSVINCNLVVKKKLVGEYCRKSCGICN